jgi:hypothetical protein
MYALAISGTDAKSELFVGNQITKLETSVERLESTDPNCQAAKEKKINWRR